MLEQTPKKQYKPIFNRTYLKYLGFVVAIAIIFLSEKAPQPIAQIMQLENSAINLGILQVDSEHPARLFLSFSSTPALSLDAKTNRQLMYQSLNKAAVDIPQVDSILWTQDRLEIEFRWQQDKTLQISQILSQLKHNSRSFNTEKNRKLIAAQLYLKNQTPDNAALQILDTRFSRNLVNNDNLQQILNSSPKALLITSLEHTDPQLKELDLQLSKLFHGPATKLMTNIEWQPFEETLRHRNTMYQLLIATQLGPINNQRNALELISTFTLGELLKSTASEFAINYRLLRKPILKHGYQALLIDSEHILTSESLSKIIQHINRQSIDKALALVKNRLVDHYNTLSHNPDRLFKLYSKKYFYGLSTQSSSEYEAQLDTITPESIRNHINTILGENAIFIRLQPS